MIHPDLVIGKLLINTIDRSYQQIINRRRLYCMATYLFSSELYLAQYDDLGNYKH